MDLDKVEDAELGLGTVHHQDEIQRGVMPVDNLGVHPWPGLHPWGEGTEDKTPTVLRPFVLE